MCVCVFGLFESAQHNCSHTQYMYKEYGGRQSEWRCLLYSSGTILICFTMLQVMFPMRGSISNKQDVSSSRSSISTADSPANSKLLALQEKCYHELIDVCRCIADSLGVNSSSIMNVQVKSLIHFVVSWFLPMQSLFIVEFFLFTRKDRFMLSYPCKCLCVCSSVTFESDDGILLNVVQRACH